MPPQRPDPRLPTHVRPQRYEPHLDVRLEQDTFSGEVRIELSIEEPTSSFQLHAADTLQPEEATLTTPDGPREVSIEPLPDAERWHIVLAEAVEAGRAELTIGFEGRLGEAMSGLYRSEAGAKRCLVTQCEPSDARAVFPCFDEPSFKAEVAWRVTAEANLTVLANGERLDTHEHTDGTATRVFAPTPPIPAYLAALAVGDFEATEAREHRGVPFRVWALRDAAELGERARDQAARLMSWFEDYFEQPYPYAKYDQLAVPSFSFGAMENVGLVVFRESLLLLDRERATWDETKAVDRVVAHELAHMWFGNLVTMAWWDDLWLNEAFAEWIAHEAVDALEPDHEVWHAFRRRSDQALAKDALDSTHAIYHPVETPAEAMEMFDAITYGKGSAVMRMLADYLGEEAFQQGLASYIETFAETNARGQDLWAHLEQASETPVTDVMRAWITQPGHPCVDVTLDDDAEATRLELSQQRHRARRSSTLQAPTWPVPVVLRYADPAGIHEQRVLLTKSRRAIELDVTGELSWCLANAGQGGFYRARHGPELEARLVDHARELSPAERWGLLRDSFSLVKAGRRAIDEHLALLDALATGQAHFAFVDDLVGHVRELERLLEGQTDAEALAGLRAWTRRRFAEAYEELGAEARGGEDPSRRHRRATVLGAYAAIGQAEDARQAAIALAERERDDPDEVEPELASASVNVAARAGDHGRFTTHLATYRQRREAELPPQQVERYLHSLPLFREEASVEALLTAIEAEDIPAQSIGPLLESLLSRPHAQGQALAFVRSNHEALKARVGLAWIARILEAAGQASPAQIDTAEALLDEIGEAAPESAKRARERLEQTRELVDAGVVDELAEWAREQG